MANSYPFTVLVHRTVLVNECKRIFDSCVSLFSYQGSCRSFLATAFILYQSCFCLSRTFLTFFKVFYQLLSFSATAVLDYHIFIRLSRTFFNFFVVPFSLSTTPQVYHISDNLSTVFFYFLTINIKHCFFLSLIYDSSVIIS